MRPLDLTDPPDEAAWLRIAERSPTATPFSTPVWARVAEVRGFTAAPLGMRTADGTAVVYPLVRRKRRVAASLAEAQSSWAGTYGGPLAERELSAEEQAGAHLALLRATRGKVGVLLPPEAARPAESLPCEVVPDSTHLMAIDEDFETLLRRFRQSHRRRYKRGVREGIVMRRANGAQAVQDYLEMYESSIRRWGEGTTVRYPPEVFERLDAVSRDNPGVVRLSFAERDGVRMAASWTLHWGGRGFVWAVASHDPPEGLSPINVLYGELFREAAEEGASVFDLNPSAGIKGVKDAKSFYGAVETPVWRLQARRPLAEGATTAINLLSRARRAGGR